MAIEAGRWSEGLSIPLQSLLKGSPWAFLGWVVVCVCRLGVAVVTEGGTCQIYCEAAFVSGSPSSLVWTCFILAPSLPVSRSLGFDCYRSTRPVFSLFHGEAHTENDKWEHTGGGAAALASAAQSPSWGSPRISVLAQWLTGHIAGSSPSTKGDVVI